MWSQQKHVTKYVKFTYQLLPKTNFKKMAANFLTIIQVYLLEQKYINFY